MKLKSAMPLAPWRSLDIHHKSGSRGQSAFESWRPLKDRVREHWEQNSAASIATRYPIAINKLFDDAIKRCPGISMLSDVMDGQPCIAGTRIPVRAVLRALEQYGSLQEVKACYPHLNIDQLEDALYFSQIVLELPSGLDETPVAS
jgi:uncharacterized protein (DUF433 family)